MAARRRDAADAKPGPPARLVHRLDLLDRLRLDVPVAQAGMGGGLAGPEVAGAVAAAGGLGTWASLPRPNFAVRSIRCVIVPQAARSR